MAKCTRTELSDCDEAAAFLQSGFWGAFKARFGWEALAFRLEMENFTAALLVLRRSLAVGFSLAYLPWGPELPESCPDKYAALGEIGRVLREVLPKDTCFIRFDLPWLADEFSFPEPFVRSGADVQAPDTVLVDLTPPAEAIFEQMKPKWRYNARLAIKKGVSVRRAGVEGTDVFYDLLKETARRDGIAIHGKDYYMTLLESGWYMGKKPDIRLYLAEHERDTIAGIVTLFRGPQAVYLYGASSGVKRNLMAPYALQAKAIEDAKEAGCEAYDLFGIPPNADPSHPMAGLYRFKTGFGGSIVHRAGSWDYPCRPLVYRLFRAAETLRKKLRTIKKRAAQRPGGSSPRSS
jgi:lipid II:glycine glycyltransferase (peptidoglycan interpeptide bridge formation enzyme)